MAVISGTTIAMMAISAAAAIASGIQAKKTSDAQADIYNQQAKREREIGELNAKRSEIASSALMAKQRALLAGSGADASTGSALLIQSDMAETAEFERRLEIAGGETQAVNAENNARLAKYKGSSALTSSAFRAGAGLLSQANTAIG